MMPKTEIRCSLVYNKLFEKGFSKKDYVKLIKDCEKFEKLYKKYINRILRSIEKHHHKKWKRNFIPIYIINAKKSSFSDPLTLRYFDNEKMMLVLLVHELFHNNSFGKKKFKNSKEVHEYMEPLVNKVVRDLPIDLEKELEMMNNKTMLLASKNSK